MTCEFNSFLDHGTYFEKNVPLRNTNKVTNIKNFPKKRKLNKTRRRRYEWDDDDQWSLWCEMFKGKVK